MFTILSKRNKNKNSQTIFNRSLKRKKSANIYEHIANIPKNSAKKYGIIQELSQRYSANILFLFFRLLLSY